MIMLFKETAHQFTRIEIKITTISIRFQIFFTFVVLY